MDVCIWSVGDLFMKTFNVRFAAILLAIVVIFGVAVGLVHNIQVHRNAKSLLTEVDRAEQQAKEAVAAKDLAAEQKATQNAKKYLQMYLRLNPRDINARERLGLMLADQLLTGRIPANTSVNEVLRPAFNSLEQVVRQDPTRNKARHHLVQLTMLMHRYSDAKDHLQILLEKSPTESCGRWKCSASAKRRWEISPWRSKRTPRR